MKKILSLISVCVFITGTASSAVACNLWPVTQKDNTYDSIDLAIRSLLNTRINVPEINSENKEKINEYVTDIILQELSKKEYRDPEIKFNKDLLTEISFIDIATKKIFQAMIT
ncbi:hypothetical protein NPX79_03670 [Spiroplasma endosymbiont of Anurida maritima]|uniref:hypothetical protein n=1 Tax=Spiroplasma endosymbiont of Anurida maritima TaxID=2967972 RepID=UPI0036D404BB